MPSPISPSSLHPKFFAIPAGIFFVLAIFNLDNLIGGTIALVASLLIILTKAGMEFSEDHDSFREYYSLFGWRAGRWKLLPPIVGVTVKYFSEVSSGRPSKYSWNDAPTHYEKLVVMLSVKNKPTGIIIGNFSLDDVNPAIDFAHDVAEEFDVPVHLFLPDNRFKQL
ncbi:hypothetical protein Q3A66_18490 [Hymenobacter sp. BT770]|uniref:hypothetical protein n=1 Tax=Hymenobacter sp. BT770 TaxID=2886942 RepID=UPI001D11F2C8|nr:hypothetical protein [Hymenobacter sp. BT770]MCC3155118.1 hypothetical protein [Hymenobacter sp. BT770]MDO3417061.1 hypothetical protein [Hymenobacter sp. BT770]